MLRRSAARLLRRHYGSSSRSSRQCFSSGDEDADGCDADAAADAHARRAGSGGLIGLDVPKQAAATSIAIAAAAAAASRSRSSSNSRGALFSCSNDEVRHEVRELLGILRAGGGEADWVAGLRKYGGVVRAEAVAAVLAELTPAEVEAGVVFFAWCDGRAPYKHGVFTLEALFSLLVRAGQTRRAHRMLPAYKPFPVSPRPYTYGILIRGYLAADDLPSALKVLQEMRQRRLRPTLASCNLLLKRLLDAGEQQKAMQLLEDMLPPSSSSEAPAPQQQQKQQQKNQQQQQKQQKQQQQQQQKQQQQQQQKQPNVVTYNTLIASLCKSGRLEDARSVVTMMQERGVQPDVVTINTLLHALCTSRSGSSSSSRKPPSAEELEKRANAAVELFEQLCSSSSSKPNTITYTILMDALLRCRRDTAVQSLLQRMYDSGLSLDLVAYNTLINRFCRARMMDRAVQLLEQMKNAGVAPDVVTFNTLMQGYCRLGDADAAAEVVERMMKPAGVEANAITYTTLLHALLKAGRLQQTHRYLMEMRGKQQQHKGLFDAITYVSLISSVSKLGKGMLAFQLLQEMISSGFTPSLLLYSTVADALAKSGHAQHASKLTIFVRNMQMRRPQQQQNVTRLG